MCLNPNMALPNVAFWLQYFLTAKSMSFIILSQLEGTYGLTRMKII